MYGHVPCTLVTHVHVYRRMESVFFNLLLAHMITIRILGVINPRRACAARVTVVGSVCVCLSVTQHLASRTFIRPTNDMTYLTGDEGQKFCGGFSENAPLQS